MAIDQYSPENSDDYFRRNCSITTLTLVAGGYKVRSVLRGQYNGDKVKRQLEIDFVAVDNIDKALDKVTRWGRRHFPEMNAGPANGFLPGRS